MYYGHAPTCHASVMQFHCAVITSEKLDNVNVSHSHSHRITKRMVINVIRELWAQGMWIAWLALVAAAPKNNVISAGLPIDLPAMYSYAQRLPSYPELCAQPPLERFAYEVVGNMITRGYKTFAYYVSVAHNMPFAAMEQESGTVQGYVIRKVATSVEIVSRGAGFVLLALPLYVTAVNECQALTRVLISVDILVPPGGDVKNPAGAVRVIQRLEYTTEAGIHEAGRLKQLMCVWLAILCNRSLLPETAGQYMGMLREVIEVYSRSDERVVQLTNEVKRLRSDMEARDKGLEQLRQLWNCSSNEEMEKAIKNLRNLASEFRDALTFYVDGEKK